MRGMSDLPSAASSRTIRATRAVLSLMSTVEFPPVVLVMSAGVAAGAGQFITVSLTSTFLASGITITFVCAEVTAMSFPSSKELIAWIGTIWLGMQVTS